MLKIYIFFVLFSIAIFITNGELSEEIKKNIKFVCGDAVISGERSGHLDGPGDLSTAVDESDSFPRNFTLKKPIKKEDNLTIEFSVTCGVHFHPYPLIPNICDILDSQSDDNKTNLCKAFIDLLGFNVSSTCPIPAGTYKLKQQNDYNPWLSDHFGSLCSETDKLLTYDLARVKYGLLHVDIMDGDYPIMITAFHQIKLNDTDDCMAHSSPMSDAIFSSYTAQVGGLLDYKSYQL